MASVRAASHLSLPSPAAEPSALLKGASSLSTATSTAGSAASSVGSGLSSRRQRAVWAVGGGWLLFLALFSVGSGTALDLLLQALSLITQDVNKGPHLAFLMTLIEFGVTCLLAVACGGRLSLTAVSGKSAALKGGAAAAADDAADGTRGGKCRAAGQCLRIFALGALLCAVQGLPILAGLWLQYPIKVLINSMTLIPTMVVSQLVGNSRRFSHTEYVSATICCLGIAGASMKTSSKVVPAGLVCLGVWLLLTSVLANVINVNVQQVLMQRRGTSTMSLLLCQNFVGLMLVALGMCITVGLPDMVRHMNQVELCYALAIGAANAATAWAYIHVVNEAGCVSQVGLLTLRKFVAVALSYAFFPKPFAAVQPLGVFTAVGGLSLGCAAPAPALQRTRGWKHHSKNQKNRVAAAHEPTEHAGIAAPSGLTQAERSVEEPIYERAEEVAAEIINAFAGGADDAAASASTGDVEEAIVRLRSETQDASSFSQFTFAAKDLEQGDHEAPAAEAAASDAQPPCDSEAADAEQGGERQAPLRRAGCHRS